jgi:SAM-dependent methyltransferase
VVAIIAARDEADILDQVIGALVRQEIDVYFMDDGSTDGTLDVVGRYLNRGVIGIERVPESETGYQWERILRRKSQLAGELTADWFIHHDADEFRESPWPGLELKAAIERVDRLGFNAIDHLCLHFWPVHDQFRPGDDVREAFKFYEAAAPYDRVQIRCWKKQPALVDLASSGGHDVRFPGRAVFPLKFILRHYPIRSEAHGARKVADRRQRTLPEERHRGWHVQYEDVGGTSFLRDASKLTSYDPEALRLALQACVGFESGLEGRLQDLHRVVVDAQANLDRVTRERAALAAEISLLHNRTEQQRLALHEELRSHITELERVRHEVVSLRASKSWLFTAPLRAVYEMLTNVPQGNMTHRADDQRRRPARDVWGVDRGLPIDRYYIDRFLTAHRADIRGVTLEIKDDGYTRRLGGSTVTDAQVLDIDPSNPLATIVADLTRAESIDSDRFDCFILTQTLHVIYDMHAALSHALRLLKPGGVLFCTIPAVSRVNYENGGLDSGDYWRLTGAAVWRLFEAQTRVASLSVESYGNVRVCAAFLYGMAAEEISAPDLTFNDPLFPLIHCVRATKRS